MINFKNYKTEPLNSLILLTRKNDYRAMEELVRREQDKIYMTFYYLCPDCDNLFDLTQEALLRMCKGITSLKNPNTFRSWLNRIISNLFYDELRKKHRHPNCCSADEEKENGMLLQICDKCPCPDENTLHQEVEEIIRESISKLPDNFRLVMVLREFGGLSYDEISKVTGVEVGTVKSRISRARRKMKECLEPYFES